MPRDFLRQPRCNLFRLCGPFCALLQRNVCAWEFFAVDGDAYDGGVLDGRVIEKERFEFGRGDLVAFNFYEFL